MAVAHGIPVVIVAAGGFPVTQVETLAKVGAVVTGNGQPVTLVSAGAKPMILRNADDTTYTP
jgi:hypothetical protein